MKRKVRSSLLLACAMLLSSAAAQATPILRPIVGSIDLLVISDPAFTTITAFDVRSAMLVSVDNPMSVGGAIITDGVILGGLPPALPNHHLLVASFSLLESGLFTFSNPRIGGQGVLLDAVFTPLTAITDPALAVIASHGMFTFDFALFTQARFGAEILTGLQMIEAFSAVPEPATLFLAGCSLATLAGLRRFVRR